MSGNILTPEQRDALPAVMRGRKVEALKVRRANAPVAPGDGRSVGLFCRILHPGPDTVRGWPPGFGGTGLAPVDPAAYPEREGKLTRDEDASLRATLRESPPRDTNGVRDIIPPSFGQEYTRGGAIRPMHRLGFDYVKPKPLPRRQGGAGGLHTEVRTDGAGRAGRRGDRPPRRGAPRIAEPSGPRLVLPVGQARGQAGDGPTAAGPSRGAGSGDDETGDGRGRANRRHHDPAAAAETGARPPRQPGDPLLPGQRPLPSRETITRRRPCPSWSGRNAASGCTSRRPTPRTRPRSSACGASCTAM